MIICLHVNFPFPSQVKICNKPGKGKYFEVSQGELEPEELGGLFFLDPKDA